MAFRSEPGKEHDFRNQIVAAAKQLGYGANLTGPRAWSQLRIGTEDTFPVLVSIHAMARLADGVMAATVSSFLRSVDDEPGSPRLSPASAIEDDGPFTFTEDREPQELEDAFGAWLAARVGNGLAAGGPAPDRPPARANAAGRHLAAPAGLQRRKAGAGKDLARRAAALGPNPA